MTPAQFAALDLLFNSGFKPAVWGSDAAGSRIGPHPVATRTKQSLERRGWIRPEASRIADDGTMTDRLVWTEEGRRAFIAAGGLPGAHGGRKARQRRR
jgi:hypothetical protein